MDDPILEIELEDCPVCRGVGAIEDEQNWCVYVMCMDCGTETAHVDDDACGSLLDLLGQLGNDCLLLGKDLCVRHTWFHLHENLRRTSVRPGQRRSKRNCPHAERHEDRKASSK